MAMKRVMQNAMRAGSRNKSKSGRAIGRRIARAENVSRGRVPLHTIRADVDYATAEAGQPTEY